MHQILRTSIFYPLPGYLPHSHILTLTFEPDLMVQPEGDKNHF